MIAPAIAAGMKDTDMPAGHRVSGLDLRAFEFVARVASQTQVLEFRSPAARLRDDVVNDESSPGDGSQSVTVSTSPMRFRP
jgi:hypothetical protein